MVARCWRGGGSWEVTMAVSGDGSVGNVKKDEEVVV